MALPGHALGCGPYALRRCSGTPATAEQGPMRLTHTHATAEQGPMRHTHTHLSPPACQKDCHQAACASMHNTRTRTCPQPHPQPQPHPHLHAPKCLAPCKCAARTCACTQHMQRASRKICTQAYARKHTHAQTHTQAHTGGERTHAHRCTGHPWILRWSGASAQSCAVQSPAGPSPPARPVQRCCACWCLRSCVRVRYS